MITAFIDESGDLGFSDGSSGYFVIAVILTKDPAAVRRVMRRARDTIRKSKKRPQELKWNASRRTLRQRVLSSLAAEEVEIHFIVLNKSTLYTYLREKKDKIYHYICGILLEQPTYDEPDLRIILDNRCKKGFIRDDLSTYLLNKLSTKSFRIKARIEHKRSEEDKGLQAADFVAGAAFAKYQHKDSSYLKALKDKDRVVTDQELFKRGNK